MKIVEWLCNCCIISKTSQYIFYNFTKLNKLTLLSQGDILPDWHKVLSVRTTVSRAEPAGSTRLKFGKEA